MFPELATVQEHSPIQQNYACEGHRFLPRPREIPVQGMESLFPPGTDGARLYVAYYPHNEAQRGLPWGQALLPLPGLGEGALGHGAALRPELDAEPPENAVCRTVAAFLQEPGRFLSEVARRSELPVLTAESLRGELADLEQRGQVQLQAEARAFRLAAQGLVSDEVYAQEVGLIRAHQRWTVEERERLRGKFRDVVRFEASSETVAALGCRIASRLESEDREFALEAINAHVHAAENGEWELELSAPVAQDLQAVNTSPGFR